MRKVFLYLYPIEEYTKLFLYDKSECENALTTLNECIQNRYRNNGYEVVFALYPDKSIYGVIPKQNDRIIYTDISFCDSIKKYPNEQMLLEQIGNVDKLVIGGYHANDCAKRVALASFSNGIDTLIDLDMTDLFFSMYKHDDYFNKEFYDPQKCKEYILKKGKRLGKELALKKFDEMYGEQFYGFDEDDLKKIK